MRGVPGSGSRRREPHAGRRTYENIILNLTADRKIARKFLLFVSNRGKFSYKSCLFC